MNYQWDSLPFSKDSTDSCNKPPSDPSGPSGPGDPGCDPSGSTSGGGFCAGSAQAAGLPMPGSCAGNYTGGQVIWPGGVAIPPCTAVP
jgi:hypothetical protein